MQSSFSTIKKNTAFLLLLCLLAPALYGLHFYGNRLAHRMRMWSGEQSMPLHTLTLDSATIRWTKKNRELIVNDAYFDVKHIRYQQGVATIAGYYDQEETEMHEAFVQQQQQRADKHSTRRLAQWLTSLWYWQPASLFGPPPPAIELTFELRTCQDLANPYLSNDLPPPRYNPPYPGA